MKSLLHQKTSCTSVLSGLMLVGWHLLLIPLSILGYLSIFPSLTLGSVFCYFLVVLFIGSRMRAVGNVIHECSHRTFVPSKLANEQIGKGLCLLQFSCFQSYRKDHMAHHRHLGHSDKDPDFKAYLSIRKRLPSCLLKRRKGVRYYILYASCSPVNWFHTFTQSLSVKGNLFFHIPYLILLCVLANVIGWGVFFGFFVIPFLSSYQALKVFSDMMDHDDVYFFPDIRYKSNNHTFSVLILNWLFFPRNDAYHLVHHLFPRMPVTEFDRLHRKLIQENKFYAKRDHTIF